MPLTLLADPPSIVAQIREVTHYMPQLRLLSIRIIYLIQDGFTLLGFTPRWKHAMMNSLRALTDGASWQMKISFNICCDLYCARHLANTRPDEPPLVTFAVCNEPDRDTFELQGTNVKFMGVGEDLIKDESNTQIILTGKKLLNK